MTTDKEDDGATTPFMLTTAEVAKLLNISERTLEDWRLRGGGPRYIKVGRLVRYLYTDVVAFIERGGRSNTGQGPEPEPSPC